MHALYYETLGSEVATRMCLTEALTGLYCTNIQHHSWCGLRHRRHKMLSLSGIYPPTLLTFGTNIVRHYYYVVYAVAYRSQQNRIRIASVKVYTYIVIWLHRGLVIITPQLPNYLFFKLFYYILASTFRLSVETAQSLFLHPRYYQVIQKAVMTIEVRVSIRQNMILLQPLKYFSLLLKMPATQSLLLLYIF